MCCFFFKLKYLFICNFIQSKQEVDEFLFTFDSETANEVDDVGVSDKGILL